MKRVLKYEVEGNMGLREIPREAKFLCIQMQYDKPMMWFEVDSLSPKAVRKFTIVGTGHEFNGGKYMGTFQHDTFVWHVYEDLI
jgi:hypothetical protein